MDEVNSYRSRTSLLRQQLSDCNRTIAELRGRLKERETISIELRKLLRDVCLAEEGAVERAKALAEGE